MKKLSIVSLASAVAMALPYSATANEGLHKALADGEANLSLRYRFEYVDDDAATDKAYASTLKTRLNYKSAEYQNTSVFLEYDSLAVIGDDSYNSKQNGNTNRGVVADPKYTDLNQAYINYNAGDTQIRYGRQRILLDNQRFVGGVGWRQNEQTYDGFTLVNKSFADTTITYALIDNVNTILNTDNNVSDTDLLNVKYTGLGFADVTAYAYLLEGGIDTDTYGVRVASKKNSDSPIFYLGEYATQEQDVAGGKDAGYMHVKVGGDFEGVKAWFGYEVQESDNGTFAFKTPFGTNHKFNGWADKFLATPAAGLDDIYVGASTKIGDYKVTGVYHNFTANEGAADDFGSELDLVVGGKVCKTVNMAVKLALYSKGDDYGTDTTKLWLQFAIKF